MSGIHIEGSRMVMLIEGTIVSKDELDQSALPEEEMPSHLPVSVCQFDIHGELMCQNAEALKTFGPSKYEATKTASGESATKKRKVEDTDCEFRRRFVDKALGQRVFDEVTNHENDYCVSIEAEQQTTMGPRWSAIEVRRTRDPVTENAIIVSTARDITDIMIIEAKKEADQANMQKSEFLSVVAHEIRTPLHQVIGFVELLNQTPLNTEQTEFVNLLQSSALSLMAVVIDLLDYTKLAAGKVNLESIPFEAKTLVNGSLSAIRVKAEDKKLCLESNLEGDIPVELIGDPNRLRQILLILLGNAVEFTEQGSITLSAVRMKDDDRGRVVLRFEVQDTGIGISPEHQRQVFAKYRQADASFTRNYGGTGLGLSICASLAEAMGGCIGLESEVGKGSTFWFQLPLEVPSSQPNESIAKEKLDSEDYVQGLHILVAEDNKVNQKVVTAMLRRLGHTSTLVDNGQKAVDLLENNTQDFDLVLMDVQMPVLDGIEATKMIRSQGLKNPVVGLTASFQKGELPFYCEVGMNDCISKPVRMNELRRKIQENVHLSPSSASRVGAADGKSERCKCGLGNKEDV
jgi:signal transduction histidine kinase/FixJ family two-component response regulator